MILSDDWNAAMNEIADLKKALSLLQADAQRLDAIFDDVRSHLGVGWWWALMHNLHANHRFDARQAIDESMKETS